MVGFARGHGDDNVLVLFIVYLRDAEDELVLADAELGGFADGKQDWMFIVLWANSIDHMVGLKNVFLTKQFLSLLVLAIGAEDFASDGFGAFFL